MKKQSRTRSSIRADIMAERKDEAPAFVEDIKIKGDTVEEIREQLRQLRDAEARLGDLASASKTEGETISRLKHTVLPELFSHAGVDNIGLPKEGNHSAYDAKLEQFVRASIAASWPEERKAQAYAALEKHGGGNLIKTTITVYLDRTDRKKAKEVIAALKKLKVEHHVELSVPWASLTAFVKEQVNKGVMLPLETLGATIGMIVRMKERKN